MGAHQSAVEPAEDTCTTEVQEVRDAYRRSSSSGQGFEQVLPAAHSAYECLGERPTEQHARVSEYEAAALAALGTGRYVQRLSGSVDAASGDFSGAAKSARWVENGQVGGAVQEVMLSGNAFDLLAAGPTLTRERVRLGGSSRLPWALFDGVSVTGA